jgi:DNA invertase Pin-like site-specific DNA recombinase
MRTLSNLSNEILKDPKNYAAIYARISSTKDNNSINAQIEKCKESLNKRNMLTYGIYTDYVSGRFTSPPDRKGFGKLLADANANCFKTIIVYKHDRIVRNLKDWLNLKSLLKKLKINIIFALDGENYDDNSSQSEFMENFLVMLAELEPNTTFERASRGREVRREQGVYNAANNMPFGYDRIDATPELIKKKNLQFNPKSFYEPKPLESAFVQYIYEYYDVRIGNKTFTLQNLSNSILEIIDLITKRPNRKKTLKIIKDLYKRDLPILRLLDKVISSISINYKENEIDFNVYLEKIRNHLKKSSKYQN